MRIKNSFIVNKFIITSTYTIEKLINYWKISRVKNYFTNKKYFSIQKFTLPGGYHRIIHK